MLDPLAYLLILITGRLLTTKKLDDINDTNEIKFSLCFVFKIRMKTSYTSLKGNPGKVGFTIIL